MSGLGFFENWNTEVSINILFPGLSVLTVTCAYGVTGT